MNTVLDFYKMESLIRSVGGVPNARFKRALKAAKTLDKVCEESLSYEFEDYRLILTNGKEKVISVPKGDDVLMHTKGFDVYSFSKI